MRIARFVDPEGAVRFGLVEGAELLAIRAPPAAALEDWLPNLDEMRRDIERKARRDSERLALSDVTLLAPLSRPSKFLGIGGNYASHLKEIADLGVVPPHAQLWFNKQVSCLNGPFDDCLLPEKSEQTDYEGELAVVMGNTCRNVDASKASAYIAGYMVCNDVSVRDIQMSSPTLMLGKSFDTHGPVGPWLVTADEISDPHALSIRTWVNGELRQNGSTSEMRYSIHEQIAHLSSVFTLEPGDILATGTPAGVAAGMRPPRFLTHGDVVRIEIADLGAIENRFVSASTPRQTASH